MKEQPKEEIELLELFSGIGGFAKGFINAGFKIKKHYFSEIDKDAIANYKYNFKNSEYVGSVTDFHGEGIRIIRECRPSVFIWENVKGAFSSNDGADFWAILTAFANIGGYRLEWQLLNTDWFLPQNRERIYLVGHLAGRSIPGVFPIRERVQRPFKRPTSSTNIRTLQGGGKSGGHHSSMTLIMINSGVKKGYETARTGDIIDFQYPRSKTRKGRVQRGRVKTLDTSCGQALFTEGKLRRLTEIECERLQGFPDDWTKYGNYDGVIKEIAKSNRYRLTGNAVSVGVVTEVASRITLTNPTNNE